MGNLLKARAPVKRVNQNQFYQIGSAVHPLTELKAGEPIATYILPSCSIRATGCATCWLGRQFPCVFRGKRARLWRKLWRMLFPIGKTRR